VPHQEQPGLDKCQLPVDLHKTQDLVDSKTQDLVDSKTQDLVDLHKTQDLVDSKVQDLVDSKVQDLVDSKVLPLQLVKVAHRQHRHLIHSSDSLHKHVVMTQLMDRQEGLDQIMAPLPQLVLDQIMAPAPQLVTQVQSDEASLTLQHRRLMARRDLQQIMLMEAPLKHPRYSVVSLPLHQQMEDSRDQELEDSRDQELVDSRDQAHLMVLLQ
jgi:hypothetical protein